MHRATALVLVLVLALAACTDDEPVTPSAAPTEALPTATASPDEPAAPTDATPSDAPDPQLAPGQTAAFTVPGDPVLLALGDSVAAGTGLSDLREGFVWRLHGALGQARGAAYGLENLSEAGATAASLQAEQLPRALETITGASVDAIVLSVGGNDLLSLVTGGCRAGLGSPACATAIDEAVTAYAATLDATLADLRAAGPDIPIVLLAVYNPFDLGMGSQLELLAGEATSALNAAGAEVAGRHDVRVADGAAALAGRIAETTGMSGPQPDIHPTPVGHDLLAVAILEALQAGA